MIDSLFLDFKSNFSVREENLFVVERISTVSFGQEPVREASLWGIEGTVDSVKGRRGYFRRNKAYPLDIDIKVGKDGKIHCMVKFSVPEILYGCNLKIVSKTEFLEALDLLKDLLFRIGLVVEPKEAIMIRIDLIHQSPLRADFKLYARLFNKLVIPGTNQVEYNSSFLWLNKRSWGISAYEKYKQMGIEIDKSEILRMEVQLRNRNIIERVLGFDKIFDLIHNFNQLDKSYRSFLKKRLLPGINSSLGTSRELTPFASLISHHRDDSSERWRAHSLEQLGLIALCQEIGLADGIDLISDPGEGASSTVRSRRSRMKHRAREALAQFEYYKLSTEASVGSELSFVVEHLQSFTYIPQTP